MTGTPLIAGMAVPACCRPDDRRRDALQSSTTGVVYGKPDCPLCDKATAILERLQREFDFYIEHVDITEDPGLVPHDVGRP